MSRYVTLAVCAAILCALSVGALAIQWDLVDDYSRDNNPAGAWTYGAYDLTTNVFTAYTVKETVTGVGPDGTTDLSGWHDSISWDETGSIAKNHGPNTNINWGFMLPADMIRFQGAQATPIPCAKWTCPTAGRYYATAWFGGSWYEGGVVAGENCKIIGPSGELASGVIDGFVGGAGIDAFGTVRELNFGVGADLAAGDALYFIAGGAGAWGHAALVEAHIGLASELVAELSGYVKDEDANIGIPAATVSVVGGGSVTTDDSGYYTIFVPGGDVTVKATAPGYNTVEYAFASTVGSTYTHDFLLTSNGHIDGVVQSATTGYPIVGAVVSAGGKTAISDWSGNYSLELAPGTYTVTAIAGGFVSQTVVDIPVTVAGSYYQLFNMDPAPAANLAADWAEPSGNPSGVWEYFYSAGIGPQYFEVWEKAVAGAGIYSGWHTTGSWDTSGHIAKNIGTEPISAWGFYNEVGQVSCSPGFGGVQSGARYRCPADGDYKVYAYWSAQSLQRAETVSTVMLMKNLDSLAPLAQGTINGFVGSKAADYVDAVVDTAGTPNQVFATTTVSLLAGDALEFANSAADGPWGHQMALSAIVMKASETGTISGTVTAAGTSLPIANARISTMGGTLTVVTDSNGNYTLDTLAGDVELTAAHWFCTPVTKTVTLAAGGSQVVDFELDVLKYRITGTVTYSSGEGGSPAAGAKVACPELGVFDYADAAGKYVLDVPVTASITLVASHPKAAAAVSTTIGLPANALPYIQDFTLTPKGPGPYTYFVKPDGDDDADGMTVETAWKSIDNGDVKGVTEPGDKVIVKAGVYNVWHTFTQRGDGLQGFMCLTRSGTAEAPIVYEAEPGVILDGEGHTLGTAVYGIVTCNGCSYNTIKGFEVRNLNGGVAVDTAAASSSNITLEGIVVNHTYGVGIQACNGTSTNIVWKNCVIYNGFRKLVFGDAFFNGYWLDTNAQVTILNCVIDGTNEGTLQGVRLDGTSSVVIRNSIFIRCGYSALRNRTGNAALMDVDYCTFFENGIVGDGVAPDYNGPVNPGAHDQVATNPMFVNNLAGNFRLMGGSPCIDSGLDVGIAFNGTAPDRGAFETPFKIGGIRDAKNMAVGEVIEMTTPEIATVATGTFADGRYYIQDADRTVGMMVIPASGLPAVAVGSRVTVSGTIALDANGEKYIAATGQTVAGGTVSRVLGMRNVAPAAFAGVFVRVWGKVLEKTADYAVIDDASGAPIKIMLTGTVTPITKAFDQGATIAVSGPVGVAPGGGIAIRPRSNNDISVY